MTTSPKFESAMRITRIVVSFSVGGVVGAIVRNNVGPVTGLAQVQTVVGGTALGILLGDQAAQHVEKTVRDIASSDAFVSVNVN